MIARPVSSKPIPIEHSPYGATPPQTRNANRAGWYLGLQMDSYFWSCYVPVVAIYNIVTITSSIIEDAVPVSASAIPSLFSVVALVGASRFRCCHRYCWFCCFNYCFVCIVASVIATVNVVLYIIVDILTVVFSCCYECRCLCYHYCHCFEYVFLFSAVDTVTADLFFLLLVLPFLCYCGGIVL